MSLVDVFKIVFGKRKITTDMDVPPILMEAQKRKNVENLIRPHVPADTPEMAEAQLNKSMEEFDRYIGGRIITATEVRNFLQMKSKERTR